MSASQHNPVSYFFLTNTSAIHDFHPFDFDLKGMRTSFQKNPLAVTPPRNSYLWGPLLRDYYKIYYITRGTGILTLNSNEFKLSSGQLAITFPNVVISESTENPDPWEYYYIYFKSSCISDYLKIIGITETQPVFYANDTSDMSDIPLIFEELIQLNTINSPSATFKRISLITQLFSSLFNKAETASDSLHAMDSNLYVTQALRYFELNLHLKISVNEMAKSLGLNRSHFTRVFKQQMGISPNEYIIQLKIKKACEFLLLPNVSIASVANSLGYDQFSFSRVFKQKVGISPSEYHKRNSK